VPTISTRPVAVSAEAAPPPPITSYTEPVGPAIVAALSEPGTATAGFWPVVTSRQFATLPHDPPDEPVQA
jgi:hypothetical protein